MTTPYLLNEEEKIRNDDFPIKVISFMGLNEWTFGANTNHRLKSLKNALTKYLDADFYEISLTIGPEFPYQLNDNMYLYELLPHHRTLHVIVSENPKKVVPSRLIRYNNNNRKILDLREMREDDVNYISYNWIVTYNFDKAYDVILSSTHPLFDQTLMTIGNSLYHSLDIETRPEYPFHYYIDGVGESDYEQAIFVQNHINSFYYFYEKLGKFSSFKRIRFYFGLPENKTLITKQWMLGVIPIIGELMWDTIYSP
jgi:hypothetical protein